MRTQKLSHSLLRPAVDNPLSLLPFVVYSSPIINCEHPPGYDGGDALVDVPWDGNDKRIHISTITIDRVKTCVRAQRPPPYGNLFRGVVLSCGPAHSFLAARIVLFMIIADYI